MYIFLHLKWKHNLSQTELNCEVFLAVITIYVYIRVYIYTLKNAGMFQPKFGSNMDKPKCWVKNVI